MSCQKYHIYSNFIQRILNYRSCRNEREKPESCKLWNVLGNVSTKVKSESS